MRKKLLLITAAVFCLSISYGFASEKTNIQPKIKVRGFTFNDAISELNDAEIILLKRNKEKKEIKQNGFFDWVIQNEKPILVSAVVCTVVYGTFFLTGIILMGASLGCLAALYDMIYFTAFLYTGSILFALSWLFFLGAGAFWAFWGIAQHLKKNGYEARPFVETPRERERNRDELSYLSCKIGLSISFH